MLLAQEFLLLTLDPESGRHLLSSERRLPGVAGAVIGELALMERLGITADTGPWGRRGRLTVTDPSPTDDPELDRYLDFVGERPEPRAKEIVGQMRYKKLKAGMELRLLRRLAAAGVVEERPGKMLGLIPTTSWPATDPLVVEEIVGRLHRTMINNEAPTERTVIMVAMLEATSFLHKVVPAPDRKQRRDRVRELTHKHWVATAVKGAIADYQAATMA